MRWIAIVVAICVLADSASAAVSVLVTPPTSSLPPNGVQQFAAEVSGSVNTGVRWLVNGVPGGAPSLGVISATGRYIAPPDAAQTLNVTIEAESFAAPAVSGAAIVSVAAAAAPASIYHVATNGSDAASGAAGAPWRTIQHAVGAAPAGALILVHAGVYNELVTIARSGSQAVGFLTLAAAPSEHPILDGTGLSVPNGQNGLVTIVNASWVRVKGLELRNYVSHTAADTPVGVYVSGAGSHIEILDNHIHNIATTVTTAAGNALGLAVYGSAAPASIAWLTVSGNELDHLATGFSESLSLSGNVVNWEVTGNLVHDNNNIGINIEGFFGSSPNPVYDQARWGWVAGNTVYDISSKTNPAYAGQLGADGIYVDGGANVTVERNLVHNVDLGIELASEIPGRVTANVQARDNIVFHSYVVGVSLGGSDPALNGGATGCTVANNTLYGNDTTQSGSGELQFQSHATNNRVVGNIFFANAQAQFITAPNAGPAPAALDRNLYFSAVGDANSQWIWVGKTYSGLQSFRAGAGQEPHGLFANPDFVNAAGVDFRPGSTSPAIALAAVLGLVYNGLVDFAGRPRTSLGTIDAGALQH